MGMYNEDGYEEYNKYDTMSNYCISLPIHCKYMRTINATLEDCDNFIDIVNNLDNCSIRIGNFDIWADCLTPSSTKHLVDVINGNDIVIDTIRIYKYFEYPNSSFILPNDVAEELCRIEKNKVDVLSIEAMPCEDRVVEYLSMHGNFKAVSLDSEITERDADFISRSVNIETLQLTYYFASSEVMSRVATSHCIKNLYISFEELDENVVHLFFGSPSVVGLFVHGNRSIISETKALASNTILKQLVLTHFRFGESYEAFRGIAMNTSITILDLLDSNIGDNHVIMIAKHNHTIKKLMLVKNNITVKGARALFHSKTIKKLDLSDNLIHCSNHDSHNIANIKDNKSLRDLNLANCNIGDYGIKLIAMNSTIRVLGLACTAITNVGIQDFANTNRTVAHIDISHNFITDKAIHAFVNKMKSLTRVVLDGMMYFRESGMLVTSNESTLTEISFDTSRNVSIDAIINRTMKMRPYICCEATVNDFLNFVVKNISTADYTWMKSYDDKDVFNNLAYNKTLLSFKYISSTYTLRPEDIHSIYKTNTTLLNFEITPDSNRISNLIKKYTTRNRVKFITQTLKKAFVLSRCSKLPIEIVCQIVMPYVVKGVLYKMHISEIISHFFNHTIVHNQQKKIGDKDMCYYIDDTTKIRLINPFVNITTSRKRNIDQCYNDNDVDSYDNEEANDENREHLDILNKLLFNPNKKVAVSSL